MFDHTLTVGIAYTEQRETRRTMILDGFSYSAYTPWYGLYCTYGTSPSSQSSMTFYGLLYDVCLGWYLRLIEFPPILLPGEQRGRVLGL